MAVTRSVFIGKEIEENIYFVFGRKSEDIDSLIDFFAKHKLLANIAVRLTIKVFLLQFQIEIRNANLQYFTLCTFPEKKTKFALSIHLF
jgi:hypothetical protein